MDRGNSNNELEYLELRVKDNEMAIEDLGAEIENYSRKEEELAKYGKRIREKIFGHESRIELEQMVNEGLKERMAELENEVLLVENQIEEQNMMIREVQEKNRRSKQEIAISYACNCENNKRHIEKCEINTSLTTISKKILETKKKNLELKQRIMRKNRMHDSLQQFTKSLYFTLICAVGIITLTLS